MHNHLTTTAAATTEADDERARQVEAHRPLALAVASRYRRHREPFDDLVQAAMVGLLHAVDRFDPDRGVEFATFAWRTIDGELKRHLRDRSWGVRVPRRLQERFLAVSAAMDELTQRLGRSPRVSELAESMGLSNEDVIDALEVRGAYTTDSLDPPADDESRRPQVPVVEHEYGAVEHRVLLDHLLERLPERARQVIHLRFDEELTQSAIAARLGVSQMYVSRLLARSLAELRIWAAED